MRTAARFRRPTRPSGKPIAGLPADDGRVGPFPAGAAERLGDPQFRHGNDIAASVLSPCGTWLATAGPATVAVTEVATGERVRTLPSGGAVKSDGEADDVALTFSTSGRRLAVRVRDDGVRVWDVPTGDLCWRADAGHRIGFCRFGATDKEFVTVRIPWPQDRRPLIAERVAWSLATPGVLDRRPSDTAWAESTRDGSRFALRPAGGEKPEALIEWGTDAEIRTSDYGVGGRDRVPVEPRRRDAEAEESGRGVGETGGPDRGRRLPFGVGGRRRPACGCGVPDGEVRPEVRGGSRPAPPNCGAGECCTRCPWPGRRMRRRWPPN